MNPFSAVRVSMAATLHGRECVVTRVVDGEAWKREEVRQLVELELRHALGVELVKAIAPEMVVES